MKLSSSKAASSGFDSCFFQLAKLLLQVEPDHEETLRAIYIAEEALAISIYYALVARNFKQGGLTPL